MDRYKHITEMLRDEDGVLTGNCELCRTDGIEVEEHLNSDKHAKMLNEGTKKTNIQTYDSFHNQKGGKTRKFDETEELDETDGSMSDDTKRRLLGMILGDCGKVQGSGKDIIEVLEHAIKHYRK